MPVRTYPYKAWVLQPSFKPVEVELVEKYASWSEGDYGDYSSTRKLYRRGEIHATKADAIEFGRAEIERIQADLDKRTTTLDKKRAALNKAEAQ